MHVPVFPSPPVRGSVATPLSDARDVVTLPRAPAAVVSHVRGRHAVPVPSAARKRSFRIGKRRCTHRKIYPRAALVKDAARRRVTEFHVRMMDHREKYDQRDDDDDVVCSIGACNC